jgi:hypothetical protein
MPDNDVYGFDAPTVERIATVVRGFEDSKLGSPAEPMLQYASDVPLVQIVRVTSTTTTNGEYPGRIQKINPTTTPPTFADLNAADDCWVIGPNAEMLMTQKYLARMDGFGNSPSRARFIIGQGGANTAGAVLRVPSNGASNTLTSAFIQNTADGTPPTFSDSTACWTLDINGGAIQAGRYLGTFLVQHNDGKSVYGVQMASGSIGTAINAFFYSGSDHIVANGSNMDLPLDTTGFNNGTFVAISTTKIQPPSTGMYIFGANLAIVPNEAATVGLSVSVKLVVNNGTGLGAVLGTNPGFGNNNTWMDGNITALGIGMTMGDIITVVPTTSGYVTVNVQNGGNANLTVKAGSYLWMAKIK